MNANGLTVYLLNIADVGELGDSNLRDRIDAVLYAGNCFSTLDKAQTFAQGYVGELWAELSEDDPSITEAPVLEWEHAKANEATHTREHWTANTPEEGDGPNIVFYIWAQEVD